MKSRSPSLPLETLVLIATLDETRRDQACRAASALAPTFSTPDPERAAQVLIERGSAVAVVDATLLAEIESQMENAAASVHLLLLSDEADPLPHLERPWRTRRKINRDTCGLSDRLIPALAELLGNSEANQPSGIDALRHEKVRALCQAEEASLVADACRGFVGSLVNQITALGAGAELLVEVAQPLDARAAELARRHHRLTTRVAQDITRFVAPTDREPRLCRAQPARANDCLAALSYSWRLQPSFRSAETRLVVHECDPTWCTTANPARFTAALRQLAEFCGSRLRSADLTVHVSRSEIQDLSDPRRRWVLRTTHGSSTSWLCFTVQTQLPGYDLQRLRRDVESCPLTEYTGNLVLAANIAAEDRLGFDVHVGPHGQTRLNLYAARA